MLYFNSITDTCREYAKELTLSIKCNDILSKPKRREMEPLYFDIAVDSGEPVRASVEWSDDILVQMLTFIIKFEFSVRIPT